jgi:hypothetical protein
MGTRYADAFNRASLLILLRAYSKFRSRGGKIFARLRRRSSTLWVLESKLGSLQAWSALSCQWNWLEVYYSVLYMEPWLHPQQRDAPQSLGYLVWQSSQWAPLLERSPSIKVWIWHLLSPTGLFTKVATDASDFGWASQYTLIGISYVAHEQFSE